MQSPESLAERRAAYRRAKGDWDCLVRPGVAIHTVDVLRTTLMQAQVDYVEALLEEIQNAKQ